MVSLASLEKKISKLTHQADIERRKQAGKAVTQIHGIMAQYGLTVADLGKVPGRRGRPPKAATLAATGKHKGFPTGKMAPKYRDPKTGATWSGHARPPAWIKDVKDRTKFLINPAEAIADNAKPAAKKAAKPGTKAAVKKTAAKTVAAAKKSPASKKVAKSLSSTKLDASSKKATSSVKPAAKKAATKVAKKAATKTAATKTAAKKVAAKKVVAKKVVAEKAVAAKPARKVAVASRKAAPKAVKKVAAPVSTPEAAPQAPAAEATA